MTSEHKPNVDPQASAQGMEAKDIAWSDAPYIVTSGACMGTADIVPGVSGGTMAVALGIYQRLLNAIASIDVKAVQALLRFQFKTVLERVHWRFLVCLALGLGLGAGTMLLLVKLPQLLENKPKLVYGVFFGLVLGSCLVLLKRMPRWGWARASLLLFGSAFGYAVVNLIPVNTPENPVFLFFCGVIAISAMLLPGISGSFILLILGKYVYVAGSVDRLKGGDISALGVIIPFVLGCLVGLLMFARFLKWVMARWEHNVLAGMIGLLLGSLDRIWPYQHLKTVQVRGKSKVISADAYLPEQWDTSVLILMGMGVAAVLLIEVMAMRRNKALAASA